jgi:CHAD domain-containing protein
MRASERKDLDVPATSVGVPSRSMAAIGSPEHRRPIGGLADGRGGEGHHVLRAMLFRQVCHFAHELDELALTGGRNRSIIFQELDELQWSLVRGERDGTRPGMCVDEQQMDGVGPDVKNSQSHEPNLSPDGSAGPASDPGARRNYTGAMAIQDAVEIERKFDVDESSALPAFDRLPRVANVEEPVEYALDATYFDTADLALATSRITLRRRTGGEDEGWLLKTLLDSDTRQEFREPLGSDPITVPERLLRRVRVHLRDRALIPVVRLQTRRIVHRLLDADGAVLAEICDDRVRADRFVPVAETRQWREWEVELVGGDPDLLDAAQSLFDTSGVTPSEHVSKLSRALGDFPGARPSSPPRATGKSAAGEVLLAYVDANVRLLWSEDPRVREDEPDSVHQMRIAMRRLRSALTTFRPLVDADVADFLRGELKWMAGTLGAARDLQVLHQRLRDLMAAEPPELVLGPVSDRIDAQLGAEAEAARRSGLESLDDERYFRLLDALDSFLAAEPLKRPAAEPVHGVVPDLIDRQWRRLRARVRESKKAATGSPRDLALHEVRKSAKQLRYAAEAAGPVQHKAAVRLAAAAEEVQTILGEHQDSVVARTLLLRWAAEAELRGENTFSYGRLHAREEAAAHDAEARFRRAWKRFPRPVLKK